MENTEKKMWTAPVIVDLDVNLNTANNSTNAGSHDGPDAAYTYDPYL